MSQIRRKVFISYHHEDKNEVDDFIQTFDDEHDVFIARGLGCGMSDDIVNSTNVDYVMNRIRELYLSDSTVTIVLIGKDTWTRRYVDWEIQASLRHGETVTPNGLLGIVLPSAASNPIPPNRLKINLHTDERPESYAKCYYYPKSKNALVDIIEEAFKARITKAHLIDNPRDNFSARKSESNTLKKIEERMNRLENDIRNLSKFSQPTPQETQSLTSVTGVKEVECNLTEILEARKSPVVLRCKSWEDFQAFASQPQTVYFTYIESEKIFEANALKNNQIVAYVGEVPKHVELLKAWLSSRLKLFEEKVYEGALTKA